MWGNCDLEGGLRNGKGEEEVFFPLERARVLLGAGGQGEGFSLGCLYSKETQHRLVCCAG